MKQLDNLPVGIEIFTNIISNLEAEYLIDKVENAVNENNNCSCKWGIPSLHSPDITCLRRNLGINISEHGFLNADCDCGIREIDATIGKLMLKCLEKYIAKYSIGFTQDEGLIIIKQGEDHVTENGIDDNPFVNRVLSMHMPLNISDGQKYMYFPFFDFEISLSSPSIILFPSNFIYSYSKSKIDGLYEVQNYLNNDPSQEYLNQIFANN